MPHARANQGIEHGDGGEHGVWSGWSGGSLNGVGTVGVFSHPSILDRCLGE